MRNSILILSFLLFCEITYSQIKEVKEMKEIIKYGSLAPSSHNAQMWNVRIIGENQISVFPNYNRVLAHVDPENRETWISIGAFVENCVLAAQDKGYNATVKINDKEVIIDFKHSDSKEVSSYINLINKRLTIRTPFFDEALEDSIINPIKTLSDNVSYYSINSEQGNKIIEYSLDAYCLQMRDTNKLNELADWMTFSYKEERNRKDGLSPQCLGMSGMKHFFFNTFMNKKSVVGKAFINGSIKGAKEQFNACSGYILIKSDSFSISDLVESGRLLERLWLECVKLKIAVHPMSQVLEEQKYYDLLKSSLNIEGEIQMLLRVGKVKKYPERIGKRLDIEDIIIK